MTRRGRTKDGYCHLFLITGRFPNKSRVPLETLITARCRAGLRGAETRYFPPWSSLGERQTGMKEWLESRTTLLGDCLVSCFWLRV